MVYFLRSGRKLCLASSVYNMYICAETKSRSRGIHRHVSAADNRYLLTCNDRRIVIITERFH